MKAASLDPLPAATQVGGLTETDRFHVQGSGTMKMLSRRKLVAGMLISCSAAIIGCVGGVPEDPHRPISRQSKLRCWRSS
jgi:hypothetical protein